MRDSKRIPIILKEVEKLWLKYPDLRFGQLLENFIFPPVEVPCDGNRLHIILWNKEDDETLKKLKQKNKELK